MFIKKQLFQFLLLFFYTIFIIDTPRKMRRLQGFSLFLFFLARISPAFSSHLYSVNEAIDSTFGIILYEKYNSQVGGEGIRLDDNGAPCENTVIDYYDDGSVLHRGSYVDGILITYKNYYPDGKLERKFKGLAGGRYLMETYYSTGLLRSKIVYFRKDAIFWNEYYENGLVEYTEKYNSHFLLLYRRSYSETGKPQTIFELASKRKNTYSHKEYYENGAVREEGAMVFNDDVVDYKREGTWKIYDESGNLARLEEYIHGEYNLEAQSNSPSPTASRATARNASAKTNTLDCDNTTGSNQIQAKPTAKQVDSFFDDEDDSPAEDSKSGTKVESKKKVKKAKKAE
jgi:antitoxin component YwqK of YwqJK toxin-antitoxin module